MELDLYVALHYSSMQQLFAHWKTVSVTTSLIHATAPILPLVRGALGLSAFTVLVMLFRPLLSGIGRALVLLVKPRRTKAELAARRQMHDAQMLQTMINSSHGPSHAAELRALAARV